LVINIESIHDARSEKHQVIALYVLTLIIMIVARFVCAEISSLNILRS